MLQFLHLLVLIFKLQGIRSQTQNYCIWNETGSDIIVNGEYRFDSFIDGYRSYIKVIGSSCSKPTLYLWRNALTNAWQISTATTNTGDYVMECSKSSLSQCTVGSWGASNPSVYAQSGSCPEWRCASIVTTQSHHGCDGPFNQYLGDNIWKHNSLDLYFYFVPHVFHWICFSSVDTTSCPTHAFTHSHNQWVRLSGGQSTYLIFTWLNSNSQRTTSSFQVDCRGITTSNFPTQSTTRTQTDFLTTNSVYGTSATNGNDQKDDNDETKAPTADSSIVFVFTGIGIGFLICCLLCCTMTIYYTIIAQQIKRAEVPGISDDDETDEYDSEGVVMVHTFDRAIIHSTDAEKKREVMLWLKDIGLAQYYSLFITNGFDSMESVVCIQDKEALEEIGITRVGHKLMIWSSIQKIHKAFNWK